MDSKKVFYESATKKLLSEIEDMGLSADEKRKAVFYTKLFREAFKYDEIKQNVFITPNNKIWNLGYDSAGFCRIASINFAIIMGVEYWKLMCINDNQWTGQASHHYLQHVPTGKFFDITYDQFDFYGQKVPYELGHRTAFNVYPGDLSLKFADVMGIDILKMLMKKSKGKE